MNASNIDKEIHVVKFFNVSGSQWPRDLRRGSAAALLLEIAGSDHPGSMDACIL